MGKVTALILLGMMIFSLIPSFHAVGAAGVPESASISGVSLGAGDKAVLGPFKVQFVDFDKDWTQVYLQVDGPQGSRSYVLGEGDHLLYPSGDNVYLNVSLVWIRHDTNSILLEISSPIQKILSEKNMVVGDEITLPEGFPAIKIKLTSVSGSTATFKVTMPYGSTYTLAVDKGSAGRVSYKLDDKHSYSDYLTLEVTNTVNNGATVNVYLPKVASTDFQIVKKGGTSSQESNETVEKVLLYNDLLYVNEKLPVKVDGSTYYVKLVSTIPDVVKVEVLKGDESLGTMLLEAGDEPKEAPGAPLKLSVQNVEPDYKRAILRVYGPADAQVTPILRRANLMAKIDAVPRKMLLGDILVVTINVQNLGRGDAYDVNVAAPIPDGFELVSMTRTWTLKNFPAFTSMPALIYVLKPTGMGKFDIGKAIVTFYDDQSLETGEKRTVYSPALEGIEVYAVPSIDVTARAYNGTWGNYVGSKVGDSVKLRFTLSAGEGVPDYEFVTNATLLLDLPPSVDGPSYISVGTIKAGETKTVQVDLKVLSENLTNVRATLVYLDPLGNERELQLGNLVTIDSIPPKVIVKNTTIKVWPAPEELPAYINKTLAERNDSGVLAGEIKGVVEAYSPTGNPWKPLAILFILTTLVLVGAAYKYWDESRKLREKLEKKRSSRPGGLPKKSEEEESSEEIHEL
ncbi:hypothetical protein A3L12_06290 [Thermococcus sp. P6]|uniref:hypothetical protein n=1 Tax=Thermococcus sp. P6 TaxID=122420 RepID=UPI000B59F1DE|nr:hypothetical protein [Thermococcus sp. P6]ASJ10935.1 hypothetical protein A3L12_06290 [Thermococcus sp. P6]